MVLARNAVLIGALTLGGVRRARDLPEYSRGECVGSRAFTLIETILVVALVAVLTALVAPSLAGVRDKSRQLKSLSNLRGHAQIMGAYAADYRDLFPVLSNPNATQSIVRCESARIAIPTVYFGVTGCWHVGLADQYYGGRWNSESFLTPWTPAEYAGSLSYELTCSALAEPEYYDAQRTRPPPSQLRPMKQSETAFPSAKGLFVAVSSWEYWPSPGFKQQRFHGATVDGSALFFSGGDLGPQFGRGDGNYLQYTTHFPATNPLMHTEKGLQGRDLQHR
jgi:prepilin-type N-terminal cleavage/methylation domain-containing protein